MSDPLIDAILEHGTKDASIREVIVEYIQALTKAQQPEDEWREVYRRESVETRQHDMAEGEAEQVALYMEVTYSARQRVAKCDVFMAPPGIYSKRRRHLHAFLFAAPDANIAEEVFTAATYHEAIDEAWLRWPGYVDIFHARTQLELVNNA